MVTCVGSSSRPSWDRRQAAGGLAMRWVQVRRDNGQGVFISLFWKRRLRRPSQLFMLRHPATAPAVRRLLTMSIPSSKFQTLIIYVYITSNPSLPQPCMGIGSSQIQQPGSVAFRPPSSFSA